MTRLLTVPQVMDRLELSRTSVYELIRSGKLSSITIGRSRRIPASELERFVAERLEAAGAS